MRNIVARLVFLLCCVFMPASGLDDCAAAGVKAQDCGSKRSPLQTCCEGLECAKGQRCAVPGDGGGGGGGGGGGDDGVNCPTTLYPMCFGWVKGKSGKLHVLVQIGGQFADGSRKPINGADVVYETTFDGTFNTEVSTSTGTSVFNAYQNDFRDACGDFLGVTGSANCFETAPEGAMCAVQVTSISYPGCPDATFDLSDGVGNTDTCEFAGRTRGVSPCVQ